jgi:hypothetical protein
MEDFIKKYADTIICYPSGLTYSQLEENKIQKMKIIENNNLTGKISYQDETKKAFLNEIAHHIQ